MTTGAFSQNVGKLFFELKITFSSFMQKPTEKPLKHEWYDRDHKFYFASLHNVITQSQRTTEVLV